MRHLALLVGLYAASMPSAAEAIPANFFDHLAGSWSGFGKAYVAQFGDISATCQVGISGTETKIEMKGSCGVLLFRQALGLSIRQTGGNKFTGIYTGSKTGPATLNGTLRGNPLVMTITWGGLVNGDRTAQMVLERIGPDSFAQTVNDRVAGVDRNTSRFTFNRH